MTAFRWEHARRMANAGPAYEKRKEPRISNEQARLLARLQREAGVPYSGYGMTAAEAKAAIDELKERRA